jgi:hypothetical protein
MSPRLPKTEVPRISVNTEVPMVEYAYFYCRPRGTMIT